MKNTFVFFGVPTSEGSLGKNVGAKECPSYFSKLFSVQIEHFSLTQNDIEKQQSEIFFQAKNIFDSKIDFSENKVFFVGGTHEVTFSLFRAFKEKNPSAALLIFDAHVDSDEGLSTVSHEDFVRALVMKKIISPKDLMIFGARKIFPSERPFLKKKKIVISRSIKKIHEFIESKKIVYVSFDIDFLDASIMKATGYPEKKGFTKVQTEKLLKFIFSSNNVKAFDFVELNPFLITKKEEALVKSLFKDCAK